MRQPSMKFNLIDRITELVPGRRIRAVKALTTAEEYLADHFPHFPVMPGVLMIEAMTQAAAWLVRRTEDFAHSMILLAEARNVTYKSFVAPGQTLELTLDAKEIGRTSSKFVGVGRRGDTEVVRAHLTLRHFNLAEDNPAMEASDRKLVAELRQRMEILTRN
ncbi:MAG TPA: 3-hydroxyacyl-ACP dehydratase FabZ family protein [Phycisphaerae bacterium]|nr:3-hydroxyacyl-ACP dehydratase FabZ family protein [Phycisphaerae bacterium]